MIPMGYYTSFVVRAKYHYAFESGDAPDYQWWSINVGFAWSN
jgi:hypothetical protein